MSRAVPASDGIHAARSSRSIKDCKTPPKHATKLCKKFALQTRSDAAKAFSDNLPFIDLENDCEYLSSFWLSKCFFLFCVVFRKFCQ